MFAPDHGLVRASHLAAAAQRPDEAVAAELGEAAAAAADY